MVGGGSICPQILLKNGFVTLIVYCLETLMFVVTTKFFYCKKTEWLELSTFIIWKPKICNFYHNFNHTISVLKNYLAWSKTPCFVNIIVINYLPQVFMLDRSCLFVVFFQPRDQCLSLFLPWHQYVSLCKLLESIANINPSSIH